MNQNNNNKEWSFFLPVLALIFTTLKSCTIINWSWWWVLLPIYITPAFMLIAYFVPFVFLLTTSVFELITEIFKKKK